MKKTSITISFDEEKLSALKMYLTQRGVQVESELERSLETLYTKTVPAGVREFIEMKSGNTPKPAPIVKKPNLLLLLPWALAARRCRTDEPR